MLKTLRALPARLAMVLLMLTWGGAAAAQPQIEISGYLGLQSAADSIVRFSGHPNQPPGDVLIGWDGRSLQGAVYYGARITRWSSRGTGWGWGGDFIHAKAYADDDSLAGLSFDRLQLTNGHNILTATLFYRWNDGGSRWTPHVGAGLGFTIPYMISSAEEGQTRGYQFGGPAVMVAVGVSYALNDNWSIFGEYAGTYSANRLRFDEGGSMRTNLFTNALNMGLSFRF